MGFSLFKMESLALALEGCIYDNLLWDIAGLDKDFIDYARSKGVNLITIHGKVVIQLKQ